MTSAGVSSGSLPVGAAEQGQDSKNVDAHIKTGFSREDMETIKEDGELPSLVPVPNGVNDAKLTPSEGSEFEHSGRRSLISASTISPLTNKGKSPSFKRQEDDIDLMLESEDEDEPVQLEEQSDNVSRQGGPAVLDNAWADYGVKGYTLVLVQKLDNDDKIMILKAKVRPVKVYAFIITKLLSTYSEMLFYAQIKISKEYPLRPPQFELSLYNSFQGKNKSETICSEFFNELSAMEAEVSN